ncbi:polyketide synthase [Streptomyces sp. SB3404]|uniref:Polyketide synthase n=1 Tax=Streptomyces boncukensis TaxID=2711219 RepID=A0A6G4X7U8_9ACTN|nr:polyketide synthase [Streptomyces boncukensis]
MTPAVAPRRVPCAPGGETGRPALLEVIAGALRRAGTAPEDLTGTGTGVYLGCGGEAPAAGSGRAPGAGAWTEPGAAVAEDIAGALALAGPVLGVGPARSAPLLALHLACQGLRFGDCRLALAVEADLAHAPPGALRPARRPGDDGAAVLILKRRRDAYRDGDRVFAVVRSSTVNQDRRHHGAAAPSVEAQEYVLRQACREAGLPPSVIDYVEAHGVGSRIGAVLSGGPLRSVFGGRRPLGKPCLISANGPLSCGYGLAGVLKVVLALGHGEIPAIPAGAALRSAARRPGTGLRAVTDRVQWPRREYPRRAGVTGFEPVGMVAQVVLEEAEPVTPGPAVRRRGRP